MAPTSESRRTPGVEDSDAFYQTRPARSARRYQSAPPPIADVLAQSLAENPPHYPIRKRAGATTSQHAALSGNKTANQALTTYTTTNKSTPKDILFPTTEEPAAPSRSNKTKEYATRRISKERANSLLDPTTEDDYDEQAFASVAPPRPNRTAAKPVKPALHNKKRRPLSAKRLLALGMVCTLLILVVAPSVVRWWQVYQDDMHYGRPRTFHLDAVVGHNDSEEHPTHFIFLNLNHQVLIIETPGGDPSKMRTFIGPTLIGENQDLAPVWGEIKQENGKANLYVHVQQQTIFYENDGTTFKAR